MEGGFCSKLKSVLRQLYSALKSLTGLIIILILYNIIGAIIFVKLEAPYEQEQKSKFDKGGNDLLNLLSNVSAVLDWSDVEELKNRTQAMIAHLNSTSEVEENMWDFWRAMFFCGTIHTTIGMFSIYYSYIIIYHYISNVIVFSHAKATSYVKGN